MLKSKPLFLLLLAKILVFRHSSIQSNLSSTLLSGMNHSRWCKNSSLGGTEPLYKLILYTLDPISYVSPAKPGSCPVISLLKHNVKHFTNSNRKITSPPHGKCLLLGLNVACVNLHMVPKTIPQVKMPKPPGKFRDPCRKLATVLANAARSSALQQPWSWLVVFKLERKCCLFRYPISFLPSSHVTRLLGCSLTIHIPHRLHTEQLIKPLCLHSTGSHTGSVKPVFVTVHVPSPLWKGDGCTG